MSKTANSSWETTGQADRCADRYLSDRQPAAGSGERHDRPGHSGEHQRTTLAAYVGVLPSVSEPATLEEVTDYTTANVTGVVKAPDGSLAIKAEERALTAAS